MLFLGFLIMVNSISRRSLLFASVACAAKPALGQTIAVNRRSVGSMSPNDPDLMAYREAVKAMKNLPPSDPRNWEQQASIHDRFCPHQNWYFLPWHRAYLVAFERICRTLSRKSDFALPFWDWSTDGLIPAAFDTGDADSNPLIHNRPGIGSTTVLDPTGEFLGKSTIDRILREARDFESLGSRRPVGQNSTDAVRWLRQRSSQRELEGTPHNYVHGTIDGDMSSFMSPRDPIFWLHHCNIDRLWATWTNAGNANTNDPLWRDMQFRGQFVDGNGAPFDPYVRDMNSILPLGYRYRLPGELMAAPLVERNRLQDFARLSSRTLNTDIEGLQTLRLGTDGGRDVTVSRQPTGGESATRNTALSVQVPIGANLPDLVSIASSSPNPAQDRRFIATIRSIIPPKNTKTRFRVFVNCDYLTSATPISDPHYVGSFSFFDPHAAHNHGGNSGLTYEIDITSALTKIARAQRLQGDQVNVQLLSLSPQGVEPNDSRITAKTIEVAVI
jgi:tyrosinase